MEQHSDSEGHGRVGCPSALLITMALTWNDRRYVGADGSLAVLPWVETSLACNAMPCVVRGMVTIGDGNVHRRIYTLWAGRSESWMAPGLSRARATFAGDPAGRKTGTCCWVD